MNQELINVLELFLKNNGLTKKEITSFIEGIYTSKQDNLFLFEFYYKIYTSFYNDIQEDLIVLLELSKFNVPYQFDFNKELYVDLNNCKYCVEPDLFEKVMRAELNLSDKSNVEFQKYEIGVYPFYINFYNRDLNDFYHPSFYGYKRRNIDKILLS